MIKRNGLDIGVLTTALSPSALHERLYEARPAPIASGEPEPCATDREQGTPTCRQVSGGGATPPELANGQTCFGCRQAPARAEGAARRTKEVCPFGRTGGAGGPCRAKRHGGRSPILRGFRRTPVRKPDDLALAKRVQRRAPRGHWVWYRMPRRIQSKKTGCALHSAMHSAMRCQA